MLGHVRSVAPKAFERIKATALVREDVHDEVGIVEQIPTARAGSFDEFRLRVIELQKLLLDGIRDRLSLTFRVAGADDEVITESRQFADVEHIEVERFLVQRRRHYTLHSVSD